MSEDFGECLKRETAVNRIRKLGEILTPSGHAPPGKVRWVALFSNVGYE